MREEEEGEGEGGVGERGGRGVCREQGGRSRRYVCSFFTTAKFGSGDTAFPGEDGLHLFHGEETVGAAPLTQKGTTPTAAP
jgi:hypothetical protein